MFTAGYFMTAARQPQTNLEALGADNLRRILASRRGRPNQGAIANREIASESAAPNLSP